jgi:hypothetical protein
MDADSDVQLNICDPLGADGSSVRIAMAEPSKGGRELVLHVGKEEAARLIDELEVRVNGRRRGWM